MDIKMLRVSPIFLVVLLAACNRTDDGPVTPPAGKGGNATLRVTPRHHSRIIDSCTVYIKYGTKDLPASYDDSMRVLADAGERVAVFSGLQKGDYYLYGAGWDPVIADTVVGGLPVTISAEQVQPVNLPVTEGD